MNIDIEGFRDSMRAMLNLRARAKDFHIIVYPFLMVSGLHACLWQSS